MCFSKTVASNCSLKSVQALSLFPQPPNQPDSASAASVMEMLDVTLINASPCQSFVFSHLPGPTLVFSPLFSLGSDPSGWPACVDLCVHQSWHCSYKNRACENMTAPTPNPGKPPAHFQEMLGQRIAHTAACSLLFVPLTPFNKWAVTCPWWYAHPKPRNPWMCHIHE